MLDKDQILLQLFYREIKETSIIDKSALDGGEFVDNEYKKWLATKREFQLPEIYDAHWIKSCTAGYITELIFTKNGSLTEFTLFDRLKTVGHWVLDDGLLYVSIFKGENQYDFVIVANSSVNIHSAIEYKNDELHSYLKLAQTRV
ncbi:hypothetical protein [Aliivibrio finisterrensis]|uniref:Uncharacterized protein n=1 Tax=Aliivibrio finisterrensis TaxID=511998 RepID=A0A6N6RT15_9GAMM|nr:hypothetical protein [Aliivibrio finisterrensis]KAB2824779.1 hypothetical protein F8B77_09330 [Aliivibrio finisterrensis]